MDPNDHDAVMSLFGDVCDRATSILAANRDWALSGNRDGQYTVDVEIDGTCRAMLHAAGLAVLSEESGITAPDGGTVDPGELAPEAAVVLDPLDGSTNAALGLPWCATALCLVTNGVPVVAMVANLRTGDRFSAIRGQGAQLNGRSINAGDAPALAESIIAINARPPSRFRPAQFRAMGATALDIASVAAPGGFDGSVDFDDDRIGVWDYLAAITILAEAGGSSSDVHGRDLVTLDPSARRRPVTARTPELLAELLDAANRRP